VNRQSKQTLWKPRLGAIALTPVLVLAGLHRAGAAADAPARPSAGCAMTTVERSRQLQRSIEVGGVRRAYILDVPDRVQPRTPVPLLFDFHGFGHNAAGVWQASGFKDLAARDGFITVYPDGLPVELMGHTAPGWEIFSVRDNRDLAFTAALLDQLEKTYCIDRAREFATGFSNGAFFSSVLACAMSDRFAAVAPVSGGSITVPCDPPRAVPILIHHGRKDARIEVQQARAARDAWVAKNACREHLSDECEWYRQCRDGADVGYCEDDGEHYWPAKATQRIWDFFRTHPMRN
jgi:polyhydroxybutyrate depolymerase